MLKYAILLTSASVLIACAAEPETEAEANTETSAIDSAEIETSDADTESKTPTQKPSTTNEATSSSYTPPESAMTPDNPDAAQWGDIMNLGGGERDWHVDHYENDHYMILGVPETDDQDLGFDCQAGSGQVTVNFSTFVNEWETNNVWDGEMPILLQLGEGANAVQVETTLRSTQQYPGAAYTTATFMVTAQLRAAFEAPEGLHIFERNVHSLAPYDESDDRQTALAFLDTCAG